MSALGSSDSSGGSIAEMIGRSSRVDAPLVVDRLLEGRVVKALGQASLDPVVRRLGGADRAGGVQQAAFAFRR